MTHETDKKQDEQKMETEDERGPRTGLIASQHFFITIINTPCPFLSSCCDNENENTS
jgi:hypothetical protein